MNTIAPPKSRKWLRLLWLLFPTAFTFVFSYCLMGKVDALHVTVWQSALLIFSAVGLPLCFYFFKNFKNGGFSHISSFFHLKWSSVAAP